MPVYTDQDCDSALASGRKIAVIGYGSQGQAHAQNLKDSGVRDLKVALRDGSASAEKVKEAGLEVTTLEDVAAWADVVMMLLPDEYQADLYRDVLAPHMKKGAALGFAHGLNVHFGLIKPRADLDVFLVAPKGPGRGVRAEYLAGRGVPCLIAVAQDVSGTAKNLALSYASLIGGGRSCILETRFKDECETDLFGEQSVLCGGIPALIKAGYETLVEAGYPSEMAYLECLHEAKLIVDLICEGGIAHMYASVSNTAEYGGITRATRVISGDTKEEMRQILDEISSGKFAQEFMGGNKERLLSLKELREQEARHPAEEVGARLRMLMKGRHS
ncbi:MAG: ketol-acid reductoisomerase [Alphaproteobacteria bacterium]